LVLLVLVVDIINNGIASPKTVLATLTWMAMKIPHGWLIMHTFESTLLVTWRWCGRWPVQSKSGQVGVVGFGNGRPQPFVLSQVQISQINWFQHRAITEIDQQRMNADWRSRFNLHPG
jgi:hypothetical protein